MKADTVIDRAVFQLSPKRTRCELFVSARGESERVASGLLQPFLEHLRAAEEQIRQPSGDIIELQLPQNEKAESWFNKATLERFVLFVRDPTVLERISTLEAEMSQLEETRNFHVGCSAFADGPSSSPSTKLSQTEPEEDTTKRELLRAIHARITALELELRIAIARATAMGFSIEHMLQLLLFSEHFGAYRLRDACAKFMDSCQKLQEVEVDTQLEVSGMSIKDATTKNIYESPSKIGEDYCCHSPSGQRQDQDEPWKVFSSSSGVADDHADKTDHTSQRGELKVTQVFNDNRHEIAAMVREYVGSAPSEFERAASERDIGSPDRDRCSRKESVNSDGDNDNTRRLRVQNAIGLFESKQADKRDSNEGDRGFGKIESRRLSSENDSGMMGLRRWSGDSDMSMDLGNQQVTNSNQVQARGSVSDAETCIFETDLMQSDLQATQPLRTPGDFTRFKAKPQLNHELPGKTQNLEALPALHKFQNQDVSSAPVLIPCEVSASVGLERPGVEDTMYEDAPTVGNSPEMNMQVLMQMVDKFGYEGSSPGIRGKCYEHYRQKRDAKLSSVQATKKLENEARLKAMEQVLEQAKAEITGQRYRSAHVQTLPQGRKFGRESTGNFYLDQAFDKQSRKVTFKNPALDARISPPSSKDLPKPKTLPKAEPAINTPQRPVPSCRRKSQPILAKNHLTSSVPNFTDLRKENTRPSTGRAGFSFNSIREKTQPTFCAHYNGKKNSGCELAPLAELKEWRSADSKNEKKWHGKNMRKSCASLRELKVPSPPSYEGVLTPLKKSRVNKMSSSVEGKPFLRKGAGIGPGAGPGIAKTKVSPLKDYKNTEKVGNSYLCSSNGTDAAAEENDFGDITGMETSNAQCALDMPQYDTDRVRMGMNKTEKCAGKPGNLSLLQMPSSASSYGCNKGIQNLLPQSFQVSDIDAAQHVSVNALQSQKDSPKGFKRFLNFGRKGRASEIDTEERDELFRKSRMFSHDKGYELGGVSSEQHTVHCVGTSIPAPAANFQIHEEHACGGGSLLKAPRSCFSLSSFRTKESDPKSRSAAISCMAIKSSS